MMYAWRLSYRQGDSDFENELIATYFRDLDKIEERISKNIESETEILEAEYLGSIKIFE